MKMPQETWTFLSNHSHVLICIARDPDALVREIAQAVGITERAVQRIIAELEEGGYLSHERLGRRNHYQVHLDLPLRHTLEADATIADLLAKVVESKQLRRHRKASA